MRRSYKLLTLTVLAGLLLLPAGMAGAQQNEPKPTIFDQVKVLRNFTRVDPFVVTGAVQGKGGAFSNAQVTVRGIYKDQFFRYWTGSGPDGQTVIYDPYNNVWWKAPVAYLRSEIKFGKGTREGFYRAFGCYTEGSEIIDNAARCEYVDPFFFFGMDGHVYRKIIIYRYIGEPGSGPQGAKRRMRIAQYFLDLKTGERSVEPRRAPIGLIKRYEALALYRLKRGFFEGDWATWSDSYRPVDENQADGKQGSSQKPPLDKDGPDKEEQEHIEELGQAVGGGS